MKNPNTEFGKAANKRKKTKFIKLDQSNNLNPEMEYEKYFNRIKMLSRGMKV